MRKSSYDRYMEAAKNHDVLSEGQIMRGLRGIFYRINYGKRKGIDTNRLLCELAASRERREAAEGILRNIRNRGVGGWVTSAIDAYFTRYKD